ncbi:MAG: DUF1446 domain-containing protein [Lentisphaeria bacterium]|nr:DUF1446 domain-containing protein [Candidatus Neomarinimicrobiota bacterium]MCF7843120.1 DUF1446 domain-containing protein [Lentisphaeria bacterium]
MKQLVRIGNGQGFWGDSIDAPVRLVEDGPLDYLTLDYLAEVTMSIMQRQKEKNPQAGYARDFVELIDRILPTLMKKNIKVIANAGGVNAPAAAEALQAVARKHGVNDLKIGIVEGDDILSRIDELVDQGATFENMDTGAPFSEIRDRVKSANVYIGAFPLAEALSRGAQIVLAGRVTDPALALGPMIHEFGWQPDDVDKLALGTLAGHITECGAQCTGGNYSRWWEVPDYAGIGYPIIEIQPDGEFVITKHEGTGGVVNLMGVSEQILYEMGDPKNYISPDVVVDFTTFNLKDEGNDRVRIDTVKGGPATPFYKVSMSYFAGYKASGQLTISGPRAYEKAQKVAEIVWERLKRTGYTFQDTRTEYLGISSCHGDINPVPKQINEVVLRLSVRDEDKNTVNRFGKEIAPVITNGPPGITGFAGGRPKAQEIIAYWPALIPKELIQTRVTVV